MRLSELSPLAIIDIAIFSVCSAGLLACLLTAPRRDCFFLRWHIETRLLAIIVAPSLLVLWPLVLLSWLIRKGILPDDPDFYDD
jgi:hypothetical protein